MMCCDVVGVPRPYAATTISLTIGGVSYVNKLQCHQEVTIRVVMIQSHFLSIPSTPRSPKIPHPFTISLLMILFWDDGRRNFRFTLSLYRRVAHDWSFHGFAKHISRDLCRGFHCLCCPISESRMSRLPDCIQGNQLMSFLHELHSLAEIDQRGLASRKLCIAIMPFECFGGAIQKAVLF